MFTINSKYIQLITNIIITYAIKFNKTNYVNLMNLCV